MLPGSASNKGFMETMMGVKQGLKPEVAKLFEFMKNPPKYSFFSKISLTVLTVGRFMAINSIVGEFQAHFLKIYEAARKKNYSTFSLSEQVEEYHMLEEQLLKKWHAPIINDYLCMVFFGLLKKLTENWVEKGDQGASLQNDLLCGQGDLESTEPTKTLMKIAFTLASERRMRNAWLTFF